jgi:hypothetical protein
MLRQTYPFLLLALVAAACQGDGPTVPTGDVTPLLPQYAKKGEDCAVPNPHPSCKNEEGSTAQVELCAMSSVVDDIRGITEAPNGSGPLITSTGRTCECSHEWPEYCPEGTLTYSTAGPEFEWKFNGKNFVPIDHRYVLIYYPDPWPGRGLICLGGSEGANRGGRIRLSGSQDLDRDLTDAKIWIVRRAWVDCDGGGFRHRTNPDDVKGPRLTNDWDADGTADATDSCYSPFGTLPWPCDNVTRADDWLFETALIQYDDTDIP